MGISRTLYFERENAVFLDYLINNCRVSICGGLITRWEREQVDDPMDPSFYFVVGDDLYMTTESYAQQPGRGDFSVPWGG